MIKKKILLTFDIDWCPDFCTEVVLDYLANKNIKAIFFITHKSKILQRIKNENHEIGIHPNFYKGSSQGKNYYNIVNNLLTIAPDTRVIRTHRLFYDSIIFSKIFSKFKQLKYDLSTHTYKYPHIGLYKSFGMDVNFKRINFNWEDDTAAFENKSNWSGPGFISDKYIYNFHPIYIFLNIENKNRIIKLKKLLKKKKKSLINFKRNELETLINKKNKGCRNLFEKIINSSDEILPFGKFIKKL